MVKKLKTLKSRKRGGERKITTIAIVTYNIADARELIKEGLPTLFSTRAFNCYGSLSNTKTNSNCVDNVLTMHDALQKKGVPINDKLTKEITDFLKTSNIIEPQKTFYNINNITFSAFKTDVNVKFFLKEETESVSSSVDSAQSAQSAPSAPSAPSETLSAPFETPSETQLAPASPASAASAASAAPFEQKPVEISKKQYALNDVIIKINTKLTTIMKNMSTLPVKKYIQRQPNSLSTSYKIYYLDKDKANKIVITLRQQSEGMSSCEKDNNCIECNETCLLTSKYILMTTMVGLEYMIRPFNFLYSSITEKNKSLNSMLYFNNKEIKQPVKIDDIDYFTEFDSILDNYIKEYVLKEGGRHTSRSRVNDIMVRQGKTYIYAKQKFRRLYKSADEKTYYNYDHKKVFVKV